MTTLKRLCKHLATTRNVARRLFPATTLQAIQSCIAAGETVHRADVRVIVEAALPLPALLRGDHSRARAHALFSHYRMWDTEENGGVLIYINLADHKVDIVPDRAVGRALKRDDWHAVCQTMTDGFAIGKYHQGTLQALVQLNDMLALRFAKTAPNKNQLSNRPMVL